MKRFTLRPLQISDIIRSRSHQYYIVYSLKLAKKVSYNTALKIISCIMSVLDKDIFPVLFNKKLKAFKWQKKQIYIISRTKKD